MTMLSRYYPPSFLFLTNSPKAIQSPRLILRYPNIPLTPLQIREKLVAIAPEGIDKKAVAELLELKSTPNGGVGVTDDLKYNIKLGRQNGIHVSPSALWDGLLANDVSSSWAKDEWEKFLEAKVAV
ncbi:hypothetical protein FRC11_002261 [Ceratobasidium sp. 423]|nr:hypothetical protein FRC11_002261 [Ceratobasidium sp. 423]